MEAGPAETDKILPPRPNLGDVHDLLRDKSGLVVHFSGTPRGVAASSFNGGFPDDLLNVLDGAAQSGISCSVVHPGDNFDTQSIYTNATGCIGVIVRLRNPQSLVGAHYKDCGSRVEDGVRTCAQANQPMTIDQVRESILARAPGTYNEWVVKDYDVLGLLFQSPFFVHTPGNKVTAEELTTSFSGWDWYTLQSNGISRIDEKFIIAEIVEIERIYPVTAD